MNHEPLRTGQLAKVTESFPQNLTKKGISPLKFSLAPQDCNLVYRLTIKPATD